MPKGLSSSIGRQRPPCRSARHFVVELPGGLTFSVGTGFSDAQRENPPAVGSTITYRYQELTDRGVPRFPSFVRVRGRETGEIRRAGPGSLQTNQIKTQPKAKRDSHETLFRVCRR